MKKVIAFVLALTILFTLGACTQTGPTSSQTPASTPGATTSAGGDTSTGGDEIDYSKLKVCVLIHGLLGDNGYFDSAAAGAYRLRDELGVQVQVVEMGKDSAVYEANLADAAEAGYDLIIMGGFRWSSIVMETAQNYPDQKFIMYDNIGDFKNYNIPNLYAYDFAAEEGSFLAGVLAVEAAKDQANFPNAKAGDPLGVLCSADEPMLNNFVCGYLQGVAYADPDMKVLSAYIGNGQDTVKAKELALQMYSQGASFLFTPAGQTIMSIIEAAKESSGYVIGCDSDQSTLIKDSDPEGSALTITSMLKRVDNTIYDSVVAYAKGELEFGKGVPMGLKNNAVALAYNDNYLNTVPKEIQDKVEEIREKICNGEIEIWRASDKTPEEVTEYRNSFLPN